MIVSQEIRDNWNNLATDEIIIVMANDFIQGVKDGHCVMEDLERFDVMEWANAHYDEQGGTKMRLTLGSVIEAVKIVINQLQKDGE